jgi:hypothetical protein
MKLGVIKALLGKIVVPNNIWLPVEGREGGETAGGGTVIIFDTVQLNTAVNI